MGSWVLRTRTHRYPSTSTCAGPPELVRVPAIRTNASASEQGRPVAFTLLAASSLFGVKAMVWQSNVVPALTVVVDPARAVVVVDPPRAVVVVSPAAAVVDVTPAPPPPT